jgi:conjugative relaxase-like TrwC/TraI family protein
VHTTNRDLHRDFHRDVVCVVCVVVRGIVRDVVCAGWCAVTVRVTTLRGPDAAAYYVEHLPNYYLAVDEPAGVWFGHGANTLGLTGELHKGPFLAVMAGHQPTEPDRTLGGAFGEKSVRGYDITCSAPKSVSVLFGLGDEYVRGEVTGAHDAAVAALAGWIESHAHTRYRIGGEVCVLDAEGIIAARFRQHTSRALDPQVHTHLVVSNRLQSPDGRWLALDARLIKKDQRTLSAIYHAGLRAELTARLGVRWNTPENGIAEIADMPTDVLAEFSSRTADVRARIEVKLDRFVEAMGREPTVRERWKLEREAAVDSRPAKADQVDGTVLHESWAAQTRALGRDPAQLVAEVIGRVVERDLVREPERAVMIDRAVVMIGEKQSSWRPTELHRELGAIIPTATATTAQHVVELLDGMAERIVAGQCVDLSKPIPAHARLRRDGRPFTESVLDRALTTQAIIDQERCLIDWVDRRLLFDGLDNPEAASRSSRRLDSAQTRAACAVAGHADIVFIIGPAGTGKTTALAPAVAQLQKEGRVVFGVAPSATGADVLGFETGMVTDTVDKLLVEHRLNRPPQPRYRLPAGATLIVDEAGMIPTARLAELADLADTRGWRVVMVGDPMQFTSVGRGGIYGLVTDTFGAIELDRVHRFEHDWERTASLQLRAGNPDVADIYNDHGRLHGGTSVQMERAAVNRWAELRNTDQTVLLMAPTNETVERLNQRAQQHLIRTGELNPAGRPATAGAYKLYVGDQIATRQNDRNLTTDRREMVRNRATWTIDTIHPDSGITASGKHGTIRLPATYVVEHVELSYATTGMGAQGRTVQHAMTVLDGATDVRNLYVPMTRGRESNEAFITATGEQTAVDVFAQCLALDWIDRPAHTRNAELNHQHVHRPGLLDSGQLRDLFEQKHRIETTLSRAVNEVRSIPQQIIQTKRERTVAVADLDRGTTDARTAQAVIDRYDRPLHRRKHASEIHSANLKLNNTRWAITDAHKRLDTADRQIVTLTASLTEAKAAIAGRAPYDVKLAAVDRRLGHDLRIRTRTVSLEQPDHITDLIGERPAPSTAARGWDLAAGQLDQHQAAYEIGRIGNDPIDRATRLARSYEIERIIPPYQRHHTLERDVPEVDFGLSL